jgi:hypothetical protein
MASQTERTALSDRVRGPRLHRIWFYCLVLAAIGALLGWLVGDSVARHVHWVGKLRVEGRDGVAAQINEASLAMAAASREEAEKRNTGLAMGILGGVLGLALGMAGGLIRNTERAVLHGALLGSVVGTTAGVAAPWVLVPIYYQFLGRNPSPMIPVIVHSCFYAAIGGSAGLAFGGALLGRRGAARACAAGAMGGILGSVLFAVVHTIAFPMEWDFSPMPGKELSRALAHLCVALLSATCAALALREAIDDVFSQGDSTIQGEPGRAENFEQ